MPLFAGHAWRYGGPVATTDEDKQRRHRFAMYLDKAMRAAGYVRSSGGLDVPALSRMSGVADNILRRWLNEGGEPSLPNLRQVAPALGLEPLALFVASGQVLPEEAGPGGTPELPRRPPTPEERIMADDLLSDEDKSALIHTLRGLRERRSPPEEAGRRQRA
ncbi:MAG TPA: hypothetical protein VGD91_25845 [Trebonia sp.]